MKRYIFGIFAIAIAAGLAAFTAPKNAPKAIGDYYFEFDIANHAPTEDNVKNPDYWMEVSGSSGCLLSSERACRIKVPEAATQDNGANPRTLLSTADIVPAQFTTDVYYVTVAGDVTGAYNTDN